MSGTTSERVHPLILALERRDRLSEAERQALEALPWRIRPFAKGDVLIQEWSRPSESCLVLEGFAARVRTFKDGQSQILAVQVVGDFVDLHGFVLKKLDHSVVALSAGRVGFVPHDALARITEEAPHLTRVLWALAEVDGAIQRTWNAYLGRRSALMRMANIICEMYARLKVVHLVNGTSFVLPISQAELGDILGLSVVHTNRVLQELRATGLVEWQRQLVTIRNLEQLQELAEFDPTYLSLDSEPR